MSISGTLSIYPAGSLAEFRSQFYLAHLARCRSDSWLALARCPEEALLETFGGIDAVLYLRFLKYSGAKRARPVFCLLFFYHLCFFLLACFCFIYIGLRGHIYIYIEDGLRHS